MGQFSLSTITRHPLPAIVALISVAVLIHYGIDIAMVFREGIDKAPIATDFRTFMCGASVLADPYDRCHDGEIVSGFVYPPPSVIYFHALSLLPLEAGFIVQTLASLAALAAASLMMMRLTTVPAATRRVALLAALAISPIGTTLLAGQVNILVMAACIAAIYWAAVGRTTPAGIAVAIGFWIKLYPAIIPALFLTRRKWPAIVATTIVTIALGLLGLLWSSPELYRHYFVDLVPHLQKYTMATGQSIAAVSLLIEAGGSKPVNNFVAIAPHLQLIAKVALIAGVLATLFHQRRTHDRQPLETASILLGTTLIASGNSWAHHFALIMPAIFIAMAKTLDRPSWRTPMVLLCWIALVVPIWTAPPAFILDVPVLDILVNARYALVALTVILLNLFDTRSAIPADEDAA